MSEKWESIRPEQIRSGDRIRIVGTVRVGGFSVGGGTIAYGPTTTFERLAPSLPTKDGLYLGHNDDGVFRLDDGSWDDGWGNPQSESEIRPHLPLRRLRAEE